MLTIAAWWALQVSGSARLDTVMTLIENTDYEGCVRSLSEPLDSSLPSGERARGRIMLAFCEEALGHLELAVAHLREAALIDCHAEPPRFVGPKMARLHGEAVWAVLGEGDRERCAEPVVPVTPPPAIVMVPTAAPVVASSALRPVVVSTSVVGLVTLAVGAGLGFNSRRVAADAQSAHFQSDALVLNSSAQAQAMAANVAFSVAAAASVTAVVLFIVHLQRNGFAP